MWYYKYFCCPTVHMELQTLLRTDLRLLSSSVTLWPKLLWGGYICKMCKHPDWTCVFVAFVAIVGVITCNCPVAYSCGDKTSCTGEIGSGLLKRFEAAGPKKPYGGEVGVWAAQNDQEGFLCRTHWKEKILLWYGNVAADSQTAHVTFSRYGGNFDADSTDLVHCPVHSFNAETVIFYW